MRTASGATRLAEELPMGQGGPHWWETATARSVSRQWRRPLAVSLGNDVQ
jgi:hypothetical protein